MLAGLAALPPGPALAAALGALDLAQVPNAHVTDVLAAQYRQLAHDHARLAATLLEVSRSTPPAEFDDRSLVSRAGQAYAWAEGEIAAALAWTPGKAGYELRHAEQLTTVLPQVFTALWAGRIDWPKARLFADHLAAADPDLTPGQIDTICARLLPVAPGLTVKQLEARLLRLLIALDPDHARRRYRRAVRGRGITLHLDRDGTATLAGDGLPAAEAAAACARLDRLAATARRAGHPATLNQLAADLYLGMLDGRYHRLTEAEILADLLGSRRPEDLDRTRADEERPGEGGAMRHEDTAPDSPVVDPAPGDDVPAARGAAPGGPAGADRPGPGEVGLREGVEVRVGLATLLGLDDHPGELAGAGPVCADVARAAVAAQVRGAEWRFAIVDPAGYLLLAGVTRRRPHLPGTVRGRCRGGIVELQVPAALLPRLVRDLAEHSSWAGVITDIADHWARRDELTAALDARPGARFARGPLARHVQVRDRTCTHPHCGRPAARSELDHTRDHARGGPTVGANIGPGCARHHRYKTELGWQLRQPEPGTFEWRSPLGRVYRTRGEPVTVPLPAPQPRPAEPAEPITGHGLDLDLPILRRRTPDDPNAPRPPPPLPPDPHEPPPF